MITAIDIEQMNYRYFVNAAKAYYRLPGHEAGGNLHLVLSDGNCDDDSLWVCISACVAERDAMGLYIVSEMLFTMTEKQRRSFIAILDVADVDYKARSKDDMITRKELTDFMSILRRVLVELTRWIERRYPETIT